MNWQRLSNWLLTPGGQRLVLIGSGTAAVGTFCGLYLPNTLFLSKYKEVVHLYKNGLTVQLPKLVQERFETALELAGIPEHDRKRYHPFPVFGFDMFHAGSSFSKYGSIIGIPQSFSYKDTDSVNKSEIKLMGESIPWGMEEGKLLLKSLILSEKAQLYAMAREIKMTDSLKLLLDSFYATSSIIIAYTVNVAFNQKLNLFARPLLLRAMLYSLTACFVGGNYFLAKDYTQAYYEQKIDDFLKKQNPIFVEGGLEYYNKILERNRALRMLMGKEGEHLYTVTGNERYLIRQKHLPLVDRRDFFTKQPNVA